MGRTVLRDFYLAARRAAAVTRDDFRERRRLGTEDPAFASVAEQAASLHGWLSRAEGELLFELASRVPAGQVIVEIGSFLGRSTAFLASAAAPEVPVYAVDPHTGDKTWVERFSIDSADTFPAFQRNISRLGLTERVRPIVATSAEAAAGWSEQRPVGLLFIDGWHSADAVEEDGRLWLPKLAPKGVVVFDDWASPEVWEGIRRLKRSGLLTLPAVGFVGKDLVFAPTGTPRIATRPLTRKHGPIH